MPILTNEQFKQVGIEYKKNGSDSAVLLGHSLVKGESKKKLVRLWAEHLKENPGSLVYCFRGGMRSEIAVKWLQDYGVNVEKLVGGYKNFRSWIISQHLNIDKYKKEWIIIGGLTGSGKTEFLNLFKESIDLEGIANHRGSAFGGKHDGQPSQANFENTLTLDYIKHSYDYLILEDESRTIGRAGLPGLWYEKMQKSKLVVVEVSNEMRLNNIYSEYVFNELKDEITEKEVLSRYLKALSNIKKRLGNKIYVEIKDLMESGFKHDDENLHKDWILMLLTNYYDKMYHYKLGLRSEYIVFKGSESSCKDYIDSLI